MSESLLHTFRGTIEASSSLTFDHKGALIGAYTETGSCHCSEGAGFKFNPPAASGVPWTQGWLATIGGTLWGDLLMTPAGILYGATFNGGSAGQGSVFSVTP